MQINNRIKNWDSITGAICKKTNELCPKLIILIDIFIHPDINISISLSLIVHVSLKSYKTWQFKELINDQNNWNKKELRLHFKATSTSQKGLIRYITNDSFLEKSEINAEEKGRKESPRHVLQLYNLRHRFYNFEREIRQVPDWQSNVLQIVVLID